MPCWASQAPALRSLNSKNEALHWRWLEPIRLPILSLLSGTASDGQKGRKNRVRKRRQAGDRKPGQKEEATRQEEPSACAWGSRGVTQGLALERHGSRKQPCCLLGGRGERTPDQAGCGRRQGADHHARGPSLERQ